MTVLETTGAGTRNPSGHTSRNTSAASSRLSSAWGTPRPGGSLERLDLFAELLRAPALTPPSASETRSADAERFSSPESDRGHEASPGREPPTQSASAGPSEKPSEREDSPASRPAPASAQQPPTVAVGSEAVPELAEEETVAKTTPSDDITADVAVNDDEEDVVAVDPDTILLLAGAKPSAPPEDEPSVQADVPANLDGNEGSLAASPLDRQRTPSPTPTEETEPSEPATHDAGGSEAERFSVGSPTGRRNPGDETTGSVEDQALGEPGRVLPDEFDALTEARVSDESDPTVAASRKAKNDGPTDPTARAPEVATTGVPTTADRRRSRTDRGGRAEAHDARAAAENTTSAAAAVGGAAAPALADALSVDLAETRPEAFDSLLPPTSPDTAFTMAAGELAAVPDAVAAAHGSPTAASGTTVARGSDATSAASGVTDAQEPGATGPQIAATREGNETGTGRSDAAGPSRLINRVSRAIEMAQNQDGPIRLRLAPEELGSVRLTVRREAGELVATLEAENRLAHQALNDSLAGLRDRLAEMVGSSPRIELQFRPPTDDGGQSGRQFAQADSGQAFADDHPSRSSGPGGTRLRSSASPDPNRSATPTGSTRLINGRLDIRI